MKSSLFLACALAVSSLDVAAQEASLSSELVERSIHTGTHSGTGHQEVVVFEEPFRIPGAPWLRLHFTDVELGDGSYILMFAEDGGWQRLDATSMEQWGRWSAAFNGDSLHVQLIVAPADTGVFFDVEDVRVGKLPTTFLPTICGNDDRVPSSDNRVGRLTQMGTFGNSPYCTAWRGPNEAFLTAGHCADFDPDRDGPLLPDGVLDWVPGEFVEFNVPASTSAGLPLFAAPVDQYPIDTTRVTWSYLGAQAPNGGDWSVFAVFPNSNTGLTAAEAYGPGFRLSDVEPPGNSPTRVTGFGVDTTPPGSGGGTNAQNQTNQTSVGNFGDIDTSGSFVDIEYHADTEAASSGSPVIWDTLNTAIGIHTTGGCGIPFRGNIGTGFMNLALGSALQTFPGPNVRYVDAGHAFGTNGMIFHPYASVIDAVAAVPAGGIVSVFTGNYDAGGSGTLITKALTFEIHGGNVVID